MRKYIPIGAFFIIVTSGFLWLYSYSFVEIVSNNNAGSLTYSLRNQKNNKIITSTSSGSSKKLMPRGNYELTAEVDNQSYVEIVKATGFLRTTTSQVSLSPESGRKFVGNNPNNCMYFINTILASNPCGATYDTLKIHVPADSNQPTYTQNALSQLPGILESIINTNEGALALINNDDQHTIVVVDSMGRVGKNKVLEELNGSLEYRILAYKEGFLAYSPTNSDLYYYSSLAAPGEVIANVKPKNQDLGLYDVTVFGQQIALTYAKGQLNQRINFDRPDGFEVHSKQLEDEVAQNKKSGAELVIYTNNQVRRFEFKSAPAQAIVCGQDYLCTLDDNILQVFDIAGNKQKKLYSLQGVRLINSVGDMFLVVTTEGVLNLNIAERKGFFDYTFDEYRFCGLQTFTSDYALCVVDTKDRRVALLINKGSLNDNIDKKVAGLAGLNEVKNVSVYGSFIYISPQLGELVFSDELKSFTYDPTVKKAVNAKITEEINRLGIDRKTYTIINTLE